MENAKLKRLFADVSLENQAMKGLFEKRLVTAEKKACAQGLVARGVSVMRARLATGLSRSGYYRPEKDWRTADDAVINAINDVLKKSPQVKHLINYFKSNSGLAKSSSE